MTCKGKTHTFDFEPQDKIEKFKIKIFEKVGIDFNH